MKPFDLKAALAGAKVQTRNGLEVKQVTYFETDKKTAYPIVAVAGGNICSYTADGCYHEAQNAESCNDLFMVSEKKEGWINVWRQNVGGINHSCVSHPSKEKAFKARREEVNYVGDPVKIWEEEI